MDLGHYNEKNRRIIQKKLGDDYDKVFNELKACINNQKTFGSKIKKYLEDYGFFDQNENTKNSDDINQDNEIDEQNKNDETSEKNNDENSQSKTESDSSTLDLQETATMEESSEIGEDSSEGEIEYFPKIENFKSTDNYKSYTKDFDEVINAEELCDQKELEKLRYNLDKQVFSFLPLITKIANRLQRKLLAQQNRNSYF